MFNMKLRAAMFGLAIFAASAMKDPVPENPRILEHTEVDLKPANDLAGATDEAEKKEQAGAHGGNTQVNSVGGDAGVQRQTAQVADTAQQRSKITKRMAIALGVGLTAFTAGGLFTGLAVGDLMQEMSKCNLDGTPLNQSADLGMLFTGMGCVLAGLIILFVISKRAGKMHDAKMVVGISGAVAICGGIAGSLFMVFNDEVPTKVAKFGMYIPMGVAAVSTVTCITSIAFLVWRRYNVRALTVAGATVAILSLGTAAAFVGANMQEAIHDMYNDISTGGSEHFGLKTGGTAYLTIIISMSVGLFSLWFTLVRAAGFRNRNGGGFTFQALSLAFMGGVVACTVHGINQIGHYAQTKLGEATAADNGTFDMDKVDNIHNAPMLMFILAGASLFMALAMLWISKHKPCMAKRFKQ